jgi:hypothetical protein
MEPETRLYHERTRPTEEEYTEWQTPESRTNDSTLFRDHVQEDLNDRNIPLRSEEGFDLTDYAVQREGLFEGATDRESLYRNIWQTTLELTADGDATKGVMDTKLFYEFLQQAPRYTDFSEEEITVSNLGALLDPDRDNSQASGPLAQVAVNHRNTRDTFMLFELGEAGGETGEILVGDRSRQVGKSEERGGEEKLETYTETIFSGERSNAYLGIDPGNFMAPWKAGSRFIDTARRSMANSFCFGLPQQDFGFGEHDKIPRVQPLDIGDSRRANAAIDDDQPGEEGYLSQVHRPFEGDRIERLAATMTAISKSVYGGRYNGKNPENFHTFTFPRKDVLPQVQSSQSLNNQDYYAAFHDSDE